jgi:ribonuclease E
MLLKGATHNLNVRTRSDIALYLLNHKRAHLRVLEERFRIAIMVNADATLGGQLSFVIEKGEQVHSLEQAKALALQPAAAVPIEEDEDEGDYDDEETSESEDAAVGAEEEGAQHAGEEAAGEPGQGRKRRRRRRGRRGGEGREAFPQERDEFPSGEAADFAPAPAEHDLARSDQAQEAGDGRGAERPAEAHADAHGDGERRRRRRGRRGGRRNRRGRDGESFAAEIPSEPELASAVDDLDRPAPIAAAEPPEAPIAGPEAPAEPRDDAPPPAAAGPQERPPAQIASPAVPETTASEPPRRRSTVREPAPQALRDDASSPAPSFTPPPVPSVEPVVSSPAESDDNDRPRRSGWWSKRVLGKS